MSGVKRRYDGSARRAHAELVRETLVDTAREMRLRDGYAATTIPELAHLCGVPVGSGVTHRLTYATHAPCTRCARPATA